MKTVPVIVIYNEKCGNSPSCCKLLELGIKPIVVDNSTVKQGNEKYCFDNGLKYISMHGNAGLPKAYNTALAWLQETINEQQRKDTFVIWLDDDTELNRGYFESLEKAVKENPEADIFVPPVYSIDKKEILISPSVKSHEKYHRLRMMTNDELASYYAGKGPKIYSAINSGMCVRVSIYDNYRYDDKMFLDYVDHDFMYNMYLRNITPVLLKDTCLFQNFSGFAKTSLRQMIKRRKIFNRDFIIFENKIGIPESATKSYLFFSFAYSIYEIIIPYNLRMIIRKIKRKIIR